MIDGWRMGGWEDYHRPHLLGSGRRYYCCKRHASRNSDTPAHNLRTLSLQPQVHPLIARRIYIQPRPSFALHRATVLLPPWDSLLLLLSCVFCMSSTASSPPCSVVTRRCSVLSYLACCVAGTRSLLSVWYACSVARMADDIRSGVLANWCFLTL
jgi:hypothetical protein